jgi:hypothetical protein
MKRGDNENRLSDPKLARSAQAICLTQKEARRQQQLVEEIEAKQQLEVATRHLFNPFAR